jgi:hypothetical protein
MPRMKGEPAAQDLKEIEDGGVPRKCFACRQVQRRAVCINENGVRTKSFIGICQNPKCFRYVDVEKLAGWELE